MQRSTTIRQRLEEAINMLPEGRLEVVLDFVSYLRDRGQTEDFLRMQMGSKAYRDWLSPENDIYDEVFKDATP